MVPLLVGWCIMQGVVIDPPSTLIRADSHHLKITIMMILDPRKFLQYASTHFFFRIKPLRRCISCQSQGSTRMIYTVWFSSHWTEQNYPKLWLSWQLGNLTRRYPECFFKDSDPCKIFDISQLCCNLSFLLFFSFRCVLCAFFLLLSATVCCRGQYCDTIRLDENIIRK